MSFGAAFDAFVGGFSKGMDQGHKWSAQREAGRPARESKELTEEASKVAFGREPSILDRLKQKVSTLQSQPDAPVIPVDQTAGAGDNETYYADGGYVDPVEQDNGSYYRQEAARTAVPAAPDRSGGVSAPTNVPTPPPRPGGAAQSQLDNDGNIIDNTVKAVAGMEAPDQPAVATGEAGPSGVHHPIQTMIDPTGRSYPDTTTTIGGIRQVTGAVGRPITTADHINFLQTRYQLAIQKGYDPNEALKFNVQYLDNLRLQAGRSFALASAAWDAGDGEAVQKFVQNGYMMIPDGKGAKTTFANGKLTVQPIDEKTGKPSGDPVTMDKSTFMQKAQSVTGDPISFGRAVENDPLPAGYGGKSGRRGSRGRRYGAGTSDDTTTTTAAADEPKVTATASNQITRFMGGAKADPTEVSQATEVYKSLGKGADAATAVKIAKGRKDGTLKIGDGDQGFGAYNADGTKLIHKMNKTGSFAPRQTTEPTKITPDAVAAPTATAERVMKKVPGAVPTETAARPAPGRATANPASKPAAGVIPTNQDELSTVTQPEGPGLIEQGRRAASDYIKNNLGGGAPRTPTVPDPATSDNSGAALASVAELEKMLATAQQNGVRGTALRIIQQKIDRARANLR